MTNRIDPPENRRPALDWVKPTLERLSLKEALTGGGGGSDGMTPHGETTLS